MHWAATLIGRPWADNQYGPNAFFCWGLVHWVFWTRQGLALPRLQVHQGEASIENVEALKRITQDLGWRPTPGPEQPFDIVTMSGPRGKHVGTVIDTARPLLLHADGGVLPNGVAWGQVKAERLRDVGASGYGHVELWRRTA